MSDPVFVEDFEKLTWMTGKEFTKITEPGKFETGPVNEEYFSKWRFKVFRIDPATKGATRVLTHTPGWEEPNFGYHLHTEEAFRIYGEGKMPDESYSGGIQYNITRGGSYTYRPPGWVHDGSTLTDSMSFLTNDGPATHQMAPRELVGKNAMYPDDLTKAIGPRGYIKRLDTNLMPWVPIVNSDKNQYLSGYDNTSKISYKGLSRDIFTGAETLLIKYDGGYSESNGGLTTGEVEIFVLEGDLRLFGKRFGKYAYAYVPRGYEVGSPQSETGCTFLIKSSHGTWFHSRRL
ncbi:MAG: hypothetical protein JRN52_03175 [Nitrososphaerota archaeon]|nr:hypothetical protein [Nitrososphaerota archaeon]